MVKFLFGSLMKNLQQVNMFDPTVKFTDEYSEEELNFLEVNAK